MQKKIMILWEQNFLLINVNKPCALGELEEKSERSLFLETRIVCLIELR